MNDIMAVKALIAFDARVNSVNPFDETPLDIVLKCHPNTELKDLFCQLGAKSYEAMVTGRDLNNREELLMSHLAESSERISADMHQEMKYFPGEGQRILCLDGGGMKVRRVKVWQLGDRLRQDVRALILPLQCLVQIDILKTIEQMTGKSISELFDWVVGTSSGGILALGMIYGT